MNALIITLCAAVAVASASSIGIVGIVNPAAHIPSGSIGVSKDGAVVAGPAGSVRTDNGLWGHGAGAQLSGPAGDVRTRGGSVVLSGPGNGQGDDGGWSGDDGRWGGDDGQWRGDDGSWDDGDDGQWRGDGRGIGIVAPIAVGVGNIGGWGNAVGWGNAGGWGKVGGWGNAGGWGKVGGWGNAGGWGGWRKGW